MQSRRKFELVLGLAAACFAQVQAQAPPSETGVELDRVVAVVNDHAILSSDLDDEMRLSILEPNGQKYGTDKPQEALDRLISRTLIRQQIREEDAQTAEPHADEIAARLSDVRKDLPACVRENCATDEGWKIFLDNHGLTEQRVEDYLRNRLEILRFIETRFRQGIRISQQEVGTYYRETLLPQYPRGQSAPPLTQVAPRIEEILLQQQVNAMFSGWLDNLRKQGEIEVLDPSLEGAANPDATHPDQGQPGPDQANPKQEGAPTP